MGAGSVPVGGFGAGTKEARPPTGWPAIVSRKVRARGREVLDVDGQVALEHGR